MLRIFGKATGGTVTVGNSVNPLSNSGNWLFGQAQANTKLYDDSTRYLSHTGLTVDEEIWFDRDSVAKGVDNVVTRAVEWINGTTGIDESLGKTIPCDINLSQNYPNPFNPSTTINYGLSLASHVELKIYNRLGQEVRTLVNSAQPSGTHQAIWYGRDDSGEIVPSGVYFYQLQANAVIQTRKMLFIK